VLLILEYGEKTVNNAGKEILGYPGLWATSNKEFRTLKKHLEKEINDER